MLVVRAFADAPAAPYLVKDINTATIGGSSPSHLVGVGDRLYFVATDAASGAELWQSDGTAAGTVRVADIAPGRVGSWPRALTAVGGRLFFVACARPGGDDCALWTTGGTATGPVRVPGVEAGPSATGIHDLTAVGGRLYFFVDQPAERAGLWKTDGTADGTSRVTDLVGTHLMNRNGTLSFLSGGALYATDGTAAGTHALDIGQPIAREIVALGDDLFFTAAAGNTAQLWKTDGTRAGTMLLADIGQAFGDDDGPPLQVHLAGVTLANGTRRLFFRAWFDECEVWTSDGTPAGTMRLMAGSCLQDDAKDPDEPRNVGLASLGDVVVFGGCNGDQATNCEPWRTDGTPDGTAPLADIVPGLDGSDPSQFTAVGDAIFFIAFSPDGGWGLWKTDGTSHGTVRLANVAPSYFRNDYPGAVAPALGALAPVGRTLFLSACDAPTGCELWKSDGTGAGTRQVADIVPNPPIAGSQPDDLIGIGGRLVFLAEDPAAGRELWQSNGTADGTTRIAGLTPGVLSSTIRSLTPAGRLLFFTRSASWDHNEVWRTDGTEAGTVRLVAGTEPQWYADNLLAVDTTVWFTVERPGHTDIWKSDGTVGGTVAVADVPGLDVWSPPALTAMGEGVFYRACDGPTGCELWRTDMGTGVTGQVVDLCPGPRGSYPSLLTRVGGTLYFTAADTAAGWELWRSDGTAAGTTRLTVIGPGRIDSHPKSLTAAGGFLYFEALQGADGYGLWRTDGTPGGTIQLAPPEARGPTC